MATTYTKRGATAEMNDLFAAQLDNQYPKGSLLNAIAKQKPALATLLAVKDDTLLAGSEQVQVKISKERNPYGGWFAEGQGLSVDNFEHTATAIYFPKFIGYPVRWTMEEKRVNRGSQKLFGVIDAKIENTKEAIMNDLAAGLAGTGAGNTMDGIQKLVPAQDAATQLASSNTIGGQAISQSWWQSQGIDMSGVSAITSLSKYMLNIKNTIEINNGKVDWIFTDQATWETYWNNARNAIYTTPVKIADLTFDLCQFMGVPMIFDEKFPAGEMRFIDKRRLMFCVDPEYWMTWTDWQPFLNVPYDEVKYLVCVCNLVRTGARELGCLYNISE
jgi:hypothetical protein